MSGSPLVGVAFFISFLYAVYLGAFGIALAAMGDTFHLGAEVQGRLFPASFGGAILGLLVSGPLSDRFGRKPVLLLSLGLATLGLLLLSQAQTFAFCLAAVACIGGGGSAAQGTATALLSDLYPARRAALANAMQVAFGAGAVVGAPLMLLV